MNEYDLASLNKKVFFKYVLIVTIDAEALAMTALTAHPEPETTCILK